MIARKLSDLKHIQEYYIYDNPSQPSQEHKDFVKILSFLYPRSVFKGYRPDLNGLTGDQVVISTRPDFLKIHNNNRLLHIFNTNTPWAPHACFMRLIDNKLQEKYGEFDQQVWEKYIELHGRKYLLAPRDKLKFITKNFRIRKLGRKGLLRFIPILEKTRHHLNKERKLGLSYVIDDSLFFTKNNLVNIDKVEQSLFDASSRELYRDVIFADPFQLWRNYYDLLPDFLEYVDYMKLNKDSVILSIGVDRGYDIPFFLSFNVKKIYNFDPTRDWFLADYVREWVDYFPDKVEFSDYAILKEGNEIEFQLSDDRYEKLDKKAQSAFKVESKGSQKLISKKCKGMSLAELLKEYAFSRIDLIKINTAGQEYKLVDGLSDYVKKFRPQIVIPICHSSREFFETPLRLMEMCQNYRFYCKTYSYEKYQTHLYCIPAEVNDTI